MIGKDKCLNDPYLKFTLSRLIPFQSISKLHSSSPWVSKRLWVTCFPQYIINFRNDWRDTFTDIVNLPVLGIWFVKRRLSLNKPEQTFPGLSLLKSTSKGFHQEASSITQSYWSLIVSSILLVPEPHRFPPTREKLLLHLMRCKKLSSWWVEKGTQFNTISIRSWWERRGIQR